MPCSRAGSYVVEHKNITVASSLRAAKACPSPSLNLS
jgi:hypothetical protein